MADNLEQLEQEVETFIDPNGAPQSIKASNHQTLLKEVLSKTGKYVGSPYIAQKEITGTFSNGQFSFNNNGLNGSGTISVAKKTTDGLDLLSILQTLSVNNLLFIKDYAGRSAQFLYKSHTVDNTKGTYEIVIEAIAGNPNYTYQDDESQIIVLSFVTSSEIPGQSDIITLAGTRFRLCKKPSNTTEGAVEQGDFVVDGRLEDAFIEKATYNVGDINDFGTLANNFTDGSYIKVKYS